MSQSFSCHCPERQKPVDQRKWGVVHRYCNYSAFSGYQRTSSDYSHVLCMACKACGRTKAKFVALLPDIVLHDGDWMLKSEVPNKVIDANPPHQAD
jgi:hypothetical protein